MAAKKNAKFPRLVLTVALLAAIVVTLQPVVVNLYNDQQTINTAVEYERTITEASAQQPEGLATQLETARAYNERLDTSKLHDPWGGGEPNTGPEYQEYLNLLNDADTMASLRIPAINAHLPVVHGTTQESLFSGVGHMYGTSLPVGGEDTHAVLAGHHTWPGHTYFSNLEDLREGDTFYIDVYGETLAYEIDQTVLVYPDELGEVERIPGGDYVTLVTCITPPGGKLNEFRLLVRGKRVPFVAPASADSTTTYDAGAAVALEDGTIEVQEWMYPRVGLAAVASVLLLFFAFSWVRQDRKAKAYRAAVIEAHNQAQHRPKQGKDKKPVEVSS